MDVTNKKLIFDYNKNDFNFFDLFKQHLNLKELENLHEIIDKSFLPKKEISVENDQNQEIYNILYKIDQAYDLEHEKIETKGVFLSTFDKFVNHIAEKVFKEDLDYQNRPTLRVSFPGNKAVGDWHRDREYNHPIEEVNIWVPITNASNSNSIWIESSFDAEDYMPVNIDFGQFLIFDSGLKHGNVINDEKRQE